MLQIVFTYQAPIPKDRSYSLESGSVFTMSPKSVQSLCTPIELDWPCYTGACSAQSAHKSVDLATPAPQSVAHHIYGSLSFVSKKKGSREEIQTQHEGKIASYFRSTQDSSKHINGALCWRNTHSRVWLCTVCFLSPFLYISPNMKRDFETSSFWTDLEIKAKLTHFHINYEQTGCAVFAVGKKQKKFI